MTNKLTLPTRTERKFIEHRGIYDDVEVEDRPYRVEFGVFNEARGERQDRMVLLSDMDILLAGGLTHFFNEDGSRKDGAWPEFPVKHDSEELAALELPTMDDTKAEILAFADDNGIEVDSGLKKQDLLDEIIEQI